MHRKIFVTLAVLLSHQLLVAQQPVLYWFTAQYRYSPSKKWNILFDGSHRFDLNQKFHARITGLHGTYSRVIKPDKFSVGAGLGWFVYHNVNKETQHEQRAWQQAVHTWRHKRMSLENRVRFEERWRNWPIAENKKQLGLRLRYQAQLKHQLIAKKLAGVLSNEIMLQKYKGSDKTIFDQNRVYAGIELPMKAVTTSIGYLHTWSHRQFNELLVRQSSIRLTLRF